MKTRNKHHVNENPDLSLESQNEIESTNLQIEDQIRLFAQIIVDQLIKTDHDE